MDYEDDKPPAGLSSQVVDDLTQLSGYVSLFLAQHFGEIEGGSYHGDPNREVSTLKQIDTITAIDDNSIRNHLVTLAFRDLSRVLLGYTHGDGDVPETTPEIELGRRGDGLVKAWAPQRRRRLSGPPEDGPAISLDANFCTYGLWASLTIGRNIRNRFAPRRFDSAAPNAVRGLVNRLAIDVRKTNDHRLSFLLTLGQELVLIEVVKGIRGLLHETDRLDGEAAKATAKGGFSKLTPTQQADAIERAIADSTQPTITGDQANDIGVGDRIRDPRFADVQHGLISCYLARWAGRRAKAAKGGTDPAAYTKLRSELLFRSSVLIEAFVQRRVQQILDYSLDEIAQDFFDETVGIERSERYGAGFRRQRFNRAFGQTFDRWLDDVWPRFLTDQVLVARLGPEILRLGRDLPRPPDQDRFFPEELATINDQWTRTLMLRYDHSFGGGAGTASGNWRDFDDRMNLLVNLIGSRQKAPGLWHEPFTLREEVLVRAGRDPSIRIAGVE